MKNITKTEVHALQQNASEFSDGGNWSIVEGGSKCITLDSIYNAGDIEDCYIVETFTCSDALTPNECPGFDEMTWESAVQFTDAKLAIGYYSALIAEAAMKQFV